MARDDISILIDGRVPHFSKRLVELLNSEGVTARHLPYLTLRTSLLWTWKVLTGKERIIHLLQGHYPVFVYLIPIIVRKKLIVHWIGTDVSKEKGKLDTLSGRIRKWVFSKAARHLTDFEELQRELAEIPIQADIIPLVPLVPDFHPEQWEQVNGVLTYIPEERADFYGLDLVLDLAERFPELHFHITAHSGQGVKTPNNLTFHGWVKDLDSLWRQCHVLLRMTQHDGLSHTVIEALCREKYVVWTQPFPFCEKVRSLEEAENALARIFTCAGPNKKGHLYVREALDPKENLQAIITVYRQVLSG